MRKPANPRLPHFQFPLRFSFRSVSFRFVSFRFVSFRFVKFPLRNTPPAVSVLSIDLIV